MTIDRKWWWAGGVGTLLLVGATVGLREGRGPTTSRAPVGAEQTPSATNAEAPADPVESLVARGRSVFERYGCAACHGVDGAGGVPNPNYVLGTVPALDEMADRLMLFEKEEADAVVEMLSRAVAPASRSANPPFEAYPRFLAQFGAVRGVIKNGAKAAKKDPAGPEPPLQMMAWSLTESEIDAVIAYLISVYDWEQE